MTYRHIMKCKRKRDDEDHPAPLHHNIPAHPADAALHAANGPAANNLQQNMPHQLMVNPVLQAAAHIQQPLAAAHIQQPVHHAPLDHALPQPNTVVDLELLKDINKDFEEAVAAGLLNQMIPQPNQLPLPANQVAGEAAAHIPLQQQPIADHAPQAAVQPPQQQVQVLQQHNNQGILAQLLENGDRGLALAAAAEHAQQQVPQIHQPAIPADMDAAEEEARENLQGQEAFLT